MIFVDSNIPMYLVGGAHPHKDVARRLLERCAAMREVMATDVEVFQEILHRYAAINRRPDIAPAFSLLKTIVDQIFPIEMVDIERAREIVLGPRQLSARDCLHLSVMERRGIARILSFDAGFDEWPGLERMH